jgi:hypothetical protein
MTASPGRWIDEPSTSHALTKTPETLPRICPTGRQEGVFEHVDCQTPEVDQLRHLVQADGCGEVVMSSSRPDVDK